MALDIVAQDIIIDETIGFTDDDINPAIPPYDTNPTVQYLLSLDDPDGLTSPEVAFQANFVEASASAGETITSVVLSQNLAGTPFSTTVGVNSGIQTVDGNYVWLFQDLTHPNVVIGVIGTSDAGTEPAETGPLAFSFALINTSNTNADLYTVQYVPLFHPDETNPDDRINLEDAVFASVAGTSVVSFLGEDAAPGNNDFYLINSPDDASKQLLVIGLNGGTANVSEKGFGVNNQSINPGETLQVDFVTGGDLAAGDASEIQYDSHLETVTRAGFTINQITPSTPTDRVDVSIAAFNNTGNDQGTDFFDGTATNLVNITSLTLTGESGFASTIIANGTYATGSGNVTVSGLGTGIVTITGLDNVTTVDVITSSPMDRLQVSSVDSNEGLDISEFHFSTTNTNAHSEEVGSFINFDDDGPAVTADGTVSPLITDDTDIPDTASASFAPVFSVDAGADGLDGVTYALDVKSPGVDSGLDDTLSGDNILLRLNASGEVEGYLANATGTVAFLISVDENTGEVTLTQNSSVVHNDAADPVESGVSAATLAAADLVTLTATATDGDSDTDAATANIGDAFHFEDDGPTVTADGTIPTLTTDDSDLSDTTSASFTSACSTDLGADGGAVTYELGVKSADVDSGLDDTLSGDNILLRVNGNGEIEGYLENDTATVAFLISVDENTGEVTLTQDRSVIHNDPADPVESGASAAVLAAADLVTLTATATDGDGDTAEATANIGTAFTFEDDGPTITVPFDGDASGGGSDGTHETLANAANASATGAFGYDIGADARPDAFYDATHSDFVDQDGDPLNGIQIALTGSIAGGGGGNLITSDVTLASEDSDFATFDFSFTYDKDPADLVQPGTAGGTLLFDKGAGTYTITLTDPLEGFSFDLIHTSELLSKQPTSNTGHPQIVLEQLQADDGTTQNVDEDFYVQFTGNAINRSNPFGLTNNGEGASNPFDSSFAFGAHDMVSNDNETWVSATQNTNGVAGDTIQKGELLTLRFFDNNVGIATEVQQTPQTSAFAGSMAIEFDGIGNSEDLMLILNLADNGADNIFGTADDTSITRAMYVQNADIFKTGQAPSPYSSEFTLDNNDGLVIIEQNDYNAAGEEYLLQGVQIMQSGNGITGSAIDLIRETGAGGGSSVATNDLVSFDGADNDVLKIVDIAFSTTVTETPSASLDFAFQVADADGDVTDMQHILVDVA
ncbi:DUF5801 repeats-in-toxin domain-containing protein [Mesorhizobium sp. M7A.F.Ca.CA.004.11.1.1]|uniref:DUF5801 repeats-in-toxin domain-containing protein n=1 Tax=Mesorhizobium sp. M7A.F.Ca.CA.004.11.1.1 TaxID=2496698 RepID=UPI000FCB80F1|nr:DUF5801 repeats-in-toxin domain-containing protein [Mesorhizobium sp. M7A.F.Ca.CA.004.11.1.1]RVA48597.1 hypothetical protein EN929_12975 [Mesorhizobium sp. M7A.F.Ca.CA.004.11.1.1]